MVGVSVAILGVFCDISGAPQISQASRDGWFENVHLGHGNEAAEPLVGPGCFRTKFWLLES